jgi:hypothetical protein
MSLIKFYFHYSRTISNEIIKDSLKCPHPTGIRIYCIKCVCHQFARLSQKKLFKK